MTEVISPGGYRQLWQAISAPRQLFVSIALLLFLRNDLPSPRELMSLAPLRRGVLISLGVLIGLAIVAPVAAVVSLEVAIAGQTKWGSGAQAALRQEDRVADVYENILQRPLFSRSRQPLLTALPPQSGDPAAAIRTTLDPSAALRGVFMNGNQAKAFLTASENPVGVWVALNEHWSGWRVAEVRPNEVVLEAQGERQTLPLNVLGK